MEVHHQRLADLKKVLADLIKIECLIYKFNPGENFPETELTGVISDLTKIIKNAEVIR